MRMKVLTGAAVAFSLVACAQSGAKPNAAVTLENAWIRLPAVPDRPGAAYFTLRRHGENGIALDRIASPGVQRIELHDSMMHDGMAEMMAVEAVTVTDSDTIEFKPGGKHAMLFGIDPKIKAGDRLRLDFSVRPGGQISGEAIVIGPGDPPPPRQ